MIKFIKHIGLILIVTLLVVATSGYNTFSRYCFHHHSVEASVLADHHCCDEEEIATPDCCDADHDHETTHSSTHNNDDCSHCGEVETKYFKTDDFEVSERPTLKIHSLDIIKESASSIISTDAQLHTCLFGCEQSHAPPEYGRKFLIKQQQLKLDTPDLV